MPSAASVASLAGLSFLVLLGAVVTKTGYVFDPCEFVNAPDVANAVTKDECHQILSAGIKSVSKSKQAAAAELVFSFSVATRVEAGLLMGLALGSLYAMSVPFEQRHVAMGVILPIAVFPALVDAGHAGLVPFGANAFLTEAGKAFASGLLAVWAVVLGCLSFGFVGSRAAAKAKAD